VKACPQIAFREELDLKPSTVSTAGADVGRGGVPHVRLDDMPERPQQRFMSLADAAHVLGISSAQIYALVRRGEIPAMKIGGRGQWRVEIEGLERYIDEQMASTQRFIDDHPYTAERNPADDDVQVD
jgi:excisionase family DNA binding protein